MNDYGSLTGTDADAVQDRSIAFDGLDVLKPGDRRILALLYGHDWPGLFDPTAPDFEVPLAILCSRFGMDEEGVMDALSRLNRLTVRLTKGSRTITVPVFQIYQVQDTQEGETIFAYVIPSHLAPYCSAVAARASGQK